MSMLSNLTKNKKCLSRSISPENFSGEKGEGGKALSGTGSSASRDLGQGWKVSPSIDIAPKSEIVLGDIMDSGTIKHIWMTCTPEAWRQFILEIYWDNSETPAVSVPVGDFFCNGWCERSNVNSLPVVVNPAGGLNSYWEMPFKKRALIKLRNIGDIATPLYYQIDYTLETVEDDALYFSAYWNRDNPLEYKKDHVLLPKINNSGLYVGTYIAWQSNTCGWWGEGEIKFFMDGDEQYPTICGTGTEDYFGGAWNFEFPQGEYGSYSTPFLGLSQIIKSDGLYRSQQRFGMYRWHIQDPIYFSKDLKVTIQALGWRSEGRYLPLQDDIASTVFLYLEKPNSIPHQSFTKDNLEVI